MKYLIREINVSRETLVLILLSYRAPLNPQDKKKKTKLKKRKIFYNFITSNRNGYEEEFYIKFNKNMKCCNSGLLY